MENADDHQIVYNLFIIRRKGFEFDYMVYLQVFQLFPQSFSESSAVFQPS